MTGSQAGQKDRESPWRARDRLSETIVVLVAGLVTPDHVGSSTGTNPPQLSIEMESWKLGNSANKEWK